ncbi:toll/interleukin-1 receptor domain-containing protein [Phototrophicus methaneseepsis]|uniref:Toll/interleukin-1 receptor domain-containing protein n=1 Tax=Phototrophicus methaneseepsis TaxID=2710758 RepID=A0A7S8E5T5_9CHLR|nr:toll/interleukin-1 receptor domain-containing protein [Phototrophicus methaneseepsis]QPC80919.1 toll/interleukin-1 receptor domain-containing protein [Phototrophicus methaneseepsis]
MTQMFISYSRKDSTCVNQVVDELNKSDFETWFDKASLEITQDWLDRIESAIKASGVFVLFWSKNASESDYVKHELSFARLQSISGKLKVLAIMLDDMPLPMPHLQAYDMKHGCTNSSVAAFVSGLPSEWRAFSYKKSLRDQPYTDIPDTADLVSVLYDANDYCQAYIVGPPDKALPKSPENLAICLQFSRNVGDDMLSPVINTVGKSMWMLHILGPEKGGRYMLDNDDPAMWESARQFVIKSIQSVGASANTTLHFFAQTPATLMGGITIPFYRFWHVKIYNFGGSDYAEVLDIPRS